MLKKPTMILQMDDPMVAFLIKELEVLSNQSLRFKDDITEALYHFRKEFYLQMDQQRIVLGEEEEEEEIHMEGYVEKGGPVMTVHTAFIDQGKPIGEIIHYDPNTGYILVKVLDKGVRETLKCDRCWNHRFLLLE